MGSQFPAERPVGGRRKTAGNRLPAGFPLDPAQIAVSIFFVAYSDAVVRVRSAESVLPYSASAGSPWKLETQLTDGAVKGSGEPLAYGVPHRPVSEQRLQAFNSLRSPQRAPREGGVSSRDFFTGSDGLPPAPGSGRVLSRGGETGAGTGSPRPLAHGAPPGPGSAALVESVRSFRATTAREWSSPKRSSTLSVNVRPVNERDSPRAASARLATAA
jgi:hypothetical protein